MSGDPRPPIRSKVTEDEFGGFRIRIPGPRNGVAVGVLALFMGFWVWAGLRLFDMPLPRIDDSVIRVMAVILPCLCIVVACVLGYLLLVFTVSHEVVTIREAWMVIRWRAGPIDWSREFDVKRMRNLRFQSVPGWTMGWLQFQHGWKTHRFGRGITEYEGLRLVRTIRARYMIPDDREDAEPLPIED